MTEFLYLAFIAMPAVAAIILASWARAPTARWVLRLGGLAYCVLIALFSTGLLCDGSWLYGYRSCPGGVSDDLMNAMSDIIVPPLLTYPNLGPILMASAGIVEWRHRQQETLT